MLDLIVPLVRIRLVTSQALLADWITPREECKLETNCDRLNCVCEIDLKIFHILKIWVFRKYLVCKIVTTVYGPYKMSNVVLEGEVACNMSYRFRPASYLHSLLNLVENKNLVFASDKNWINHVLFYNFTRQQRTNWKRQVVQL